MSLVVFLVKAASRQAAQAEYILAMSRIERRTNPLLESFVDQPIALEDLRLPGKQVHENKQFKRCKFIGPGAIAILGGTYNQVGFLECGNIVALPEGVYLTGIVVLLNCTVENCEFYRTTVFTTVQVGQEFKRLGASVVGLPHETPTVANIVSTG
jgi:hypothetical protein